MREGARTWLAAVVVVVTGCGGGDAVIGGADEQDAEKQAFTSAQAMAMDFTFEATLWVPRTVSASGARSAIDTQLLYTIGHLNGDRSVGRLDKVIISNIRTAADSGGTKVTYAVKLPVSWGSRTNLPSQYELVLPLKVGAANLEEFTTRYKGSCVDYGAHDVDAGSMWYYYRPRASGCSLAATDVVRFTATAVVSTENTTGKYPEFHKVWEDGALNVVAIFGKYEDGATTSSDSGIAAYNAFVRAIRAQLSSLSPTTTPATVPTDPGAAVPDVTFEATIAAGKRVKVTALLVDNVRTAGAAFDARYVALSTGADLIAYNGHAGLGDNVRALARKGRFVAGQYAIFFLNGCDTYAYVDGYLAQTRALLNPDDPTGTKYMEIVTNGMPAYFNSMPGASMALIKGLLAFNAPLTYQQMFASIDSSQVVMVTGEEDNVYSPGGGGGGGGSGYSRTEQGAADKGQELRYETPQLPAGKVTVALKHDPAHPGGDADLYVRVGSAPTTSQYDCRPYAGGSNETCVVTLSSPGKVFVSVFGYAAGSNAFVLQINAEGGGTPPPPPPWAGLSESGSVAKNAEKRFVTPALAPGKYVFTLTGTGDADLYVRAGVAPTTSEWDCRPYAGGSAEQCVLTLAASAPVHVMVRGYAASSSFTLVGKPSP